MLERKALVILAAIFVTFGVVAGLLRGDGILIGAAAGALLFCLVMGVGWLASRGRRRA